MGAYADLIVRLKESRKSATEAMKLAVDTATAEKRSLTADEQTAWDAREAEVRALDERIEKFSEQEQREQRAAESRAQTGDTGREERGDAGGSRAVITSEPTVYGPGQKHSYFLDMARRDLRRGDGDGGVNAAVDRMNRHAQEINKVMPERRAAVERRAAKAYEESFTGSLRERRSIGQMERMGISPFEREKRFISRTDGQGGYFVPPLWLIDDYIPYLRAGRVFADLWRRFPLPSGTDSINIPRVTTGTATGPQTSDGGPVPGRDMADNFVNALVRTIAGQQDAAIQLLDQSPVAFDQIIFGDLMADYAMQLSAQLMIGSGSNGQLTGLYSAGTLGSSTGATTSGYVVNNNGDAWTAAAGTNCFYTSMGQLISTISRNRFAPPTGIVTNPAVWYGMATAMDSQNRPLVVPAQQGNNFNQAAADDGGPVAEGPVGHMLGLPWFIDPNIPLTFGGTNAPYIGTISNGNTAPYAGTGGSPDFTPAIAAVWDDLYLWEGELRSRTLSEVLSGTLQVRFQVYGYVANMPNRYQNSSSDPISYGNYNNVGQTAASSVLSTTGLLNGF